MKIDPSHVVGDLTPGAIHVAIVGARAATPSSVEIAKRLAALVVKAGGVVISGGANGVDAAAHLGASEAGGRTWCVLGCGAPNLTPTEEELEKVGDKERFTRILESGGAIVRPFRPETPATPQNFKKRNGVIVWLSQIVIIVQARDSSGTMNAATHAKELGREVWVVPGFGDGFVGSWQLIDRGERMLRHDSQLEARLRAPELHGDAAKVYEALGEGPKHPDEILLLTGLSTSAVASALLTLALGDVVVEGSAGLFQRKNLL